MKGAIDKYKITVDNLNKINGDLEYQMLEFEENYGKEKGRTDKARANNESHQKALSGELMIIKGQLDEKIEENDYYNSEIVEKDEKIKKLTEEAKMKDLEIASILEKNKNKVEMLNKKLSDLEYQKLEMDKKHNNEISLLEKSKHKSESQLALASHESEALQVQLKAFSDEINRINDLRSKELREKNLEIKELKQKLLTKQEQINKIENEMNKLSLSNKEDIEIDDQNSKKSLWSHVDQLNKQIDEKNIM